MPRTTMLILLVLLGALGTTGAGAQTIDILNNSTTVGAGLQSPDLYVRLSDAQHGGIFLTLTSSDSTLAYVARDQITTGAGSIAQFVPNGTDLAFFTVQGLENVTGAVTITATAPGFASDQVPVTVDIPQFRLLNLATGLSTIDPDDSFIIQTGGDPGVIWEVQRVRTGGPGVTAGITLSNPVAADLVTTTQTGPSVTVSILGGQSNSPADVLSGGVALSAQAAGVTDVTVNVPGFVGQDGGVVTVTVDPATISFGALPTKVGAGLRSRNGSLGISLNGAAHGGTTVQLVSPDSALVLVAADNTSVGRGSLEIFFPDGTSNAVFYVHGLEGVQGTSLIEVTAPGFVGAVDAVEVVAGGMDIRDLVGTIDALSPSDPFYVRVGVADPGSNAVSESQPVRPGSGGLDVALICDDPAVGLLETATALDDTVWVRIEPGFDSTRFSPSGSVAFDGVGAGTATVRPEISGFLPTLAAIKTVTVTQPVLSIPNLGYFSIGSGLQATAVVVLSASGHGGVTVHVEVDDPAIMLVADNPSTMGGQSIDLFVPDGSSGGSFSLQGLESALGTVDVSVSAPGFTAATQAFEVVVPAIEILPVSTFVSTLSDNQTEISAPDEFQARIGISNGFTNPVTAQELRPGSPGIEVTAMVDAPAVGGVLTSTTSGAAVTARIEALQSVTPATLTGGGFAFEGLAAGPVTVSVSAPGFAPQSRATMALMVQQAAFLTVPVLADVGAGLVGAINYLQLNGTAHGGTTVHLAVSDPAVALLAPDAVTLGQTELDLFVPDGQIGFEFHVHALEDTTGSVTVDLTAPGFVTSQLSADVVTPYVGMTALPAIKDVNEQPSNVLVRVGTPNASNGAVSVLQPRRPGGPPLVVTVAVSNPAVAEVLTLGGAAENRQLTFAEGEATTPAIVALGGVGLRGVGPGVTLVAATIPGFQAVGTATQELTVVQNGVALLGFPAALGAGLQSPPLVARLNSSVHGGTTLRLATSDPATAIVSANATVTGGDTLQVFVPDGQQDAVFYLQALEGALGTIAVNALVDEAAAGNRSLDIVQPAVMVSGLVDTLLVTYPADEFVVLVGIPTANAASLAVTQAVRAGAPALSCPVVLDSSFPADLMTQTTTADSVDVVIVAGAFQSAATLATGGVALVPVAAGAVMVSAHPTGFFLTTEASRQVIVSDDLSAVRTVPALTALHGNHPNPFNPKTHILFSLSRAGRVRLDIHDVRGHLVRTLVTGALPAGPHDVEWNGDDNRGRRQAAGVYLVRLQTPDGNLTHKVALVK